MRIAILEDDLDQAQLMTMWLEAAGHSCVHFAAGKPFIQEIARESFDLLLLDKILPDINGDQVLMWVRENLDWHIPVIFVTVCNTEDDIVKTLELGADDYLTKPVKTLELRARINALGRRTNLTDKKKKVFNFGHYAFNTANRSLTSESENIELTPKEFDLALFLFQNTGRLLSRGYILEKVWGRTAKLNTRTVDTHVSRLRNRLGFAKEQDWSLKAIYHYGYRLEHEEGKVSTHIVA